MNPASAATIREMIPDREQCARGSALLASAFSHDPLTQYLFPEGTARDRGSRWMFRASLGHGLRRGVVDQGDDGAGWAIWMPPGRSGMRLIDLIRGGMLSAPFAIGLGSTRRLLRCLSAMDGLHGRVMPEPHWYLLVLGVDPGLQGRGVGGRLLAHGLARAAAGRAPSYLETTHEPNIAFYRRHGFEVAGESGVPAGPRFWGMTHRG